MKKYIIDSPKQKHISEYYEFNDINEAICYVYDHCFHFVECKLFASSNVHICEKVGDDFYVAVVVDPIKNEHYFQSLYLKAIERER